MDAINTGSNLIRLCGLWKAHGEKGDYLSGTLGSAKVFLFKNRSKASEKSPDYFLCLAPLPAKDRPASEPAKPGAFVNAHGLDVSDSDIPF